MARERERERGREIDRQTGRQTYRQRVREAESQARLLLPAGPLLRCSVATVLQQRYTAALQQCCCRNTRIDEGSDNTKRSPTHTGGAGDNRGNNIGEGGEKREKHACCLKKNRQHILVLVSFNRWWILPDPATRIGYVHFLRLNPRQRAFGFEKQKVWLRKSVAAKGDREGLPEATRRSSLRGWEGVGVE